MDFTDLKSLTEASEVFTPLKIQPSFEIAQDLEDDDILRIPHGLTAKRNRRKSFHAAPQRNELFALSPKRMPLTAPRNNILNSKPISNIELSKRSLTSELKSLRGGKENSPLKINFNNSPTIMLSPLQFDHKRGSSDAGLEELNTSKYQKLDLSIHPQSDDELLNSSFKVISENEESHDEELSRIEPFIDAKGGDSSILNISKNNTADEEYLDAETSQSEHSNNTSLAKDELKPSTPSRLTESIAISPRTEQNSRVIDESLLMLDTTKSPNLDDSFVTESPLLQHNSLIIEHPGTSVLDKIDELGLSPLKRCHLSTPNQRPFFTIAQVHEIQDEFKNETEKLQENLQLKSMKILELNDQINNTKNQIFQLQDTIESLKIEKVQFLKDNELFKSENDIFRADVASLDSSLKAQDEKIVKQKFVINKFKERVQELQATIVDKTNELIELRSDFDSKSRAIDSLQSRLSEFEIQAQKLTVNLKEEAIKTEEILKLQVSTSETLELIEAKLSKALAEKLILETQLRESSELLESKTELLDVSTKENETAKNYILGLESEIETKSFEIESLKSTIIQLEAGIKTDLSVLSEKKLETEKSLTKAEKELRLKNAIIEGLHAGVFALNNSTKSLRESLKHQEFELEALKDNLADSNELLVVRKAEVDELNVELIQANQEIDNLRHVVDVKNNKIEQLLNMIEDNNAVIEDSKNKIHELDLELQKQETDHLTELEGFHSEMSNVQTMVSNKSNDLFKMKEARDQLMKDNDLLKYEVETLRDEAGEFDTRLSNLMVKLQEAKSYNKELESHLTEIKNEKSSLELETEKRLQQLAEDLYIQYSKKHEQKVQVLKKGYESKWSNKVSKAEHENEKLRREIEGLKTQLEQEALEKNKIIKLWDQYKDAEASKE